MTSLLRGLAVNPNSIQTATLSGGNGSNDTTQLAIATINSRHGNVFVIDATSLVPNTAGSKDAFVRLRDATVNAAGAYPGKTITIVVKLPAPSGSASVLGNIVILFDTNFVASNENLSTSNIYATRQSFTLVSDGVIFSLSGQTNGWGFA